MRILFTGASSFTGCWFVRELAALGHEVTATFRRPSGEYSDVRGRRVAEVSKLSRSVPGVSFGSPEFIELAGSGRFDLLCHHAADVTDYKSADFNTVAAVAANTLNIRQVLGALQKSGGRGIVLTGSVFENDEGAGSEGLAAFSPYGLSKSLTYQMFRHYARAAGLPLGKFVIPNPFGPLEEPRFTAYLVKNWFAGKTPSVETPAYVRDNIHVSLLAKAYAQFASRVAGAPHGMKLNPSGYVESQGAFALRFARQMEPRLGVACNVELKNQTQFAEPKVRINTDLLDAAALGWDQTAAWDDLGRYYRETYGGR